MVNAKGHVMDSRTHAMVDKLKSSKYLKVCEYCTSVRDTDVIVTGDQMKRTMNKLPWIKYVFLCVFEHRWSRSFFKH